MKHFLSNVRQVSGRIISIDIRSKGRDIRFVSCYAPHSGYSLDEKCIFWDKLNSLARKGREVLYIGGDMNARLHHRFQSEENILGQHIFGRGLGYLRTVSDATLENRSLFLQFCSNNQMKVMNTFFRKHPQNYCTFRENTTVHGADWTPSKYAQLDFWLVDEKWCRSCKDVTARSDIHFPSDHYIVESTVKVKLPGLKETPKHRPKFRQPTEQEWASYNHKLTALLGGVAPSLELAWDDIAKLILSAADSTLTVRNQQQKRSYISRRTWCLIEQRQHAHAQEDSHTVQALTKDIKRNAKNDRKKNCSELIA